MITRSEVLAVVEEVGADERAVRWDYSGRGMYGRTCLGLVGRPTLLAKFFAELGLRVGAEHSRLEFDDVELLTETLTQDNLGLDLVYYFPGVEVVDDLAELAGEDETDAEPDPDAARDAAVDRELGVTP